MDPTFSAAIRRANLTALQATTSDVLVIGGGITGAGVARDAAMRGLTVALVDAGDFGHGTSGASSRLIHGGLRYLEQGWFRLVFEASHERRVLLRIAPHLVRPRAFTFPVHKGSRVRRWQISAAVLLYQVLALFRGAGRFRWLSRRGVLRREPLLRDQDLLGGALYWDAQCDDARLVLANVRDAQRHGAKVASYTRVVSLEKAGGRVRGAVVEDLLTGHSFALRAQVVVNATGPWSDMLRRLDDPAAAPILRPTKGAHIAVPQARIGNHGAVTLLSPVDGRVMFVLPWGSATVVGTTDTDSTESPDGLQANGADVAYLLRSANAVFPHARLSKVDVISAWAGLRPLLAAPAASTAAVPREHVLLESPAGLVTIAGGKLTTYRVMARHTVDAVVRRLHELDGRTVARRAATDVEPLPGGEIANLRQLALELSKEGLPRETAEHLVATYGAEAAAVANLITTSSELGARLVADAPWTRADVVHQARREMALTVSDVMVRRTRLFHHHAAQGLVAAPAVAALLRAELGWSAEQEAASLRAYAVEVEAMRAAFTAAGVPAG